MNKENSYSKRSRHSPDKKFLAAFKHEKKNSIGSSFDMRKPSYNGSSPKKQNEQVSDPKSWINLRKQMDNKRDLPDTSHDDYNDVDRPIKNGRFSKVHDQNNVGSASRKSVSSFGHQNS